MMTSKGYSQSRFTTSEVTVRRLVDNLIAKVSAIPDRWGRIYALSSLLAIYVLADDGDGHAPEGATEFARDHAT